MTNLLFDQEQKPAVFLVPNMIEVDWGIKGPESHSVALHEVTEECRMYSGHFNSRRKYSPIYWKEL